MKPIKIFSCLLPALIMACLADARADGGPVISNDNQNANVFSIGGEGFYDRYRETGVPDVTTTTDYGGVTAGWTHYWPMLDEDKFFLGLDGRFSYGTDSYHSTSGTLSGAPQYEYDPRVFTGFKIGDATGYGAFFPYVGFGVRYFQDDGKGYYTNLGYYAYDRRLTQLYIPIGLTYQYIAPNGLMIIPNVEFDPLVQGYVQSRLTNGGYPYDINNTQNAGTGYGIRGSLMFGLPIQAVNIEIGPFVRYWTFSNSSVAIDPAGNGWIEPNNWRLQVGGALKINW